MHLAPIRLQLGNEQEQRWGNSSPRKSDLIYIKNRASDRPLASLFEFIPA